MTDYTPTTADVRFAMAGLRMSADRFVTRESFDRWLNEERAKAWDEGKTAMAIYSQGARMKVPYPENPHRKADS